MVTQDEILDQFEKDKLLPLVRRIGYDCKARHRISQMARIEIGGVKTWLCFRCNQKFQDEMKILAEQLLIQDLPLTNAETCSDENGGGT